MIRVLIVEDQRMAREDMENYIQSSGDIVWRLLSQTTAMAETVTAGRANVNLVLMDVLYGE